MLKQHYNIFGDIAGRFKELELLIAKMPQGVPVSVGDMVDRGRDSKKVIDFFRHHGIAIMGNHEHLMIDYYKKGGFYDFGIWFINGGLDTVHSFCEGMGTVHAPELMEAANMVDTYYKTKYGIETQEMKRVGELCWRSITQIIPYDYIQWLDSRPKMLEIENLIITHAAINPSLPLKECLNIGIKASDMRCDTSVLWNRGKTRAIPDKIQIHGHMAHKNAVVYENFGRKYGINLDSSKGKKLTGVHYPSMQLFEQEYLD